MKNDVTIVLHFQSDEEEYRKCWGCSCTWHAQPRLPPLTNDRRINPTHILVCCNSKRRPFALKLGTFHLLGKSLPTSYRTHFPDSKWPISETNADTSCSILAEEESPFNDLKRPP
jgi:hypothetical protein